jgi:class 3 adenylate cyclase
MDPSVTDPQTREARMLAAIVFTDVVGFSKLASQNEARVYVALQRDMAIMTNLCRAHGGQVLNTMGDGMLLCFSSAVDAMGCAVEIQRTFFSQAQTLPSVEILHHRIGVHLGDVIMNGDNVFGDGVNVAARLQTLALPDAVCFSHTVYEVVKNKLKIDANYLGPRQLKNLVEPVRVWQVPPMGDTRQMLADAQTAAVAAQSEETSGGVKGLKAGALVATSLAMVGLLVFGFIRLKAPARETGKDTGKSARAPSILLRRQACQAPRQT